MRFEQVVGQPIGITAEMANKTVDDFLKKPAPAGLVAYYEITKNKHKGVNVLLAYCQTQEPRRRNNFAKGRR